MSDDDKKVRRKRSPRTRDHVHFERVQRSTEGLHRGDHSTKYQPPRGESAAYYWPEGEPHPDRYVIRSPIPCRACRRLLTEHASQAVVCDGVCGGVGPGGEGGVAYVRCRSCGERWQLPVDRR